MYMVEWGALFLMCEG